MNSGRGVCQRCRQERALDYLGVFCLACRREERAQRQASKSRPTPVPVPRILWPPEAVTRGTCPECSFAVSLTDGGLTMGHKKGTDARKRRGRGACLGSGRRPVELVKAPERRREVLHQPERVDERVHHGHNRRETSAGLPGQGKRRR